MEEYPGQRRGSKLFVYDGHIYYRDSRYRLDEQRYICSLRNSRLWQCRVVAFTDFYGSVQVDGEHQHPVRNISNELRRRQFINELKRRALQHFATPLQIFNEVAREFRDVLFLVSPEAGCMHIIRERRRYRPPIPSNMNDLGEMLREYVPARPIFREIARGSDGSIAIIFSSETLINAVNDATELHMDATFKCIPYHPRASQFFVIHLRKMDTGIAAIYVLCERRTISSYNAIWRALCNMAPGLVENLKIVITDYERALISSLRQSFPLVRIRGCWFHYTRAVTRKWRKLRLNNTNSDLLQLAWGLPLLPAENFEESLDILRVEAQKIEASFENVQLFIRYIERFWLPIKDLVSVRASSVRTNNLAESCNRQLLNKLGGPFPNLFDFIEKLKIVVEQQEDILTRVNLGQDLGRYRRSIQASVDTFIYNMQTAFDNRRITVLEFLRCVSTRDLQNRINESNMRLNDENIQNNDEFPDIDELQDPPDMEPIREPIINQPRRRYRRRAGGARRPYNRSARRSNASYTTGSSAVANVGSTPGSTNSMPPPITYASTTSNPGPSSSSRSTNSMPPSTVCPSTSSVPGPSSSSRSTNSMPPSTVCPSTSSVPGPSSSSRSTNSMPTSTTCTSTSSNRRVSISPILFNYDTDSQDSNSSSGTYSVDVIDVPVPDDLNIYGQLEFLNFPEDREPIKDEEICCNCLTNRVKVLLSPCNHACLCLRCKAGKDLIDKWKRERRNSFRPLCPICRARVLETLELDYSSLEK